MQEQGWQLDVVRPAAKAEQKEDAVEQPRSVSVVGAAPPVVHPVHSPPIPPLQPFLVWGAHPGGAMDPNRGIGVEVGCATLGGALVRHWWADSWPTGRWW